MSKLDFKKFFQRYFRAIKLEKADRWYWFSVESRLNILSQVTQCDIDELSDEDYRAHI